VVIIILTYIVYYINYMIRIHLFIKIGITMKKIKLYNSVPFLVLAVLAVAGILISPGILKSHNNYVNADIAWLIVSSCLVFLMTPGLSFYYGGMVNRKNVISTILQSFIATGLVGVLWVVLGFSLAFGKSIYGIIGDPTQYFFFRNVIGGDPWPAAPTIPLLLFALFQMKFAVIAPAIVVGAVAEKVQFKAYLLFMALFTILIYAPIAHWTWNPGGFLYRFGVLDFAGGTVVHISSGCAALAGALFLKRGHPIRRRILRPANIPFVILGTSLLWFGWFGFNAGSSFAADSLAVIAFTTTITATAAAGLAWVFFDGVRARKPSAMGFCMGAIVGMVAITPAAGYVDVPQSLCIGFIASVASNLLVNSRIKFKLNDTLDVFACHGVGGIIGMLLTGVFASTLINKAGANGWLYGNFPLFIHQTLSMLLVVAYSFLMGWGIFRLVDLIYPIRVSEEEEKIGLDISQHDEKYAEAI